MKRLIHTILLLCFVTSCSIRDVRNQLNDVESYIAERPDSALAIIESIDSKVLRTKGLQAHHALLHAMALDKNYIDVKDDSLALTAVRYYQKHGHKKYLARARYYLALSYYYDRQYNKSIIELSKAEPIATKYDSLYLGFVKVLQADIHNINYNYVQELSCLEEALNIYTKIQASYYMDIAKLRIAQSYISNDRRDEAQVIFKDYLSRQTSINIRNAQSYGDYAFLMGTCNNPDFNASSSLFEAVATFENGMYMTYQDYWAWAHSLSRIGETTKSQRLVKDLKQVDSSGTAFYFMYLIALLSGKSSGRLL